MKKLVAMAIYATQVSCLMADSFTFTPDSGNGQVMATGGVYQAASVRVGETNTTTYGCATVLEFDVPKIPFGEEIVGANLTVNVAALKGGSFNGDLYSLGISSSPTVTSSDYFQGTYNTDSHAVGLQQHFLTPSTALGTLSASAAVMRPLPPICKTISMQGSPPAIITSSA